MAKPTLLEFVQDILSDADGDDVNAITDTVEADQCARVVRDCFDQIVDLHDFEHTKTLKQLAATSASTPNVMTRPEGFHTLEWIRYDKRILSGDQQNFELVYYMEVDRFIASASSLSTDDSTVDGVTLSTGHVLPVRNDKAPTYFTVMDQGSDEIVFDSYDSALETNLQASKSLAYGIEKPSLALVGSSEISLPKHLAVLVKREARAMYFDLYKDGITSEVDRTRRRAETRAQRQRNIIKNTDNDNRPDYGRK
jgi:hypothetical protein